MTTDSAVPVVLLHGVGLDGSMWASLTAQLATETVALDLPGHGAQAPLTAPTTLAEFAAHVEARLPDGACHLVGFSLGSLVAQYIARFSPERVRSLTCVSSVCQRTPSETSAVLERLAQAREDFSATVDRSIARWYPADSFVEPALVAETRRVLDANDVDSFLYAYEIFATGDQLLAAELGNIIVPTLAITGELDPGSTPEMTHRLHAAVPQSRERIVAKTRHMLPVEAPEALAAELLEFLNDVERDSDD